MSSDYPDGGHGGHGGRRQSIPLQDLLSPSNANVPEQQQTQRQRDGSPTPAQLAAHLPGISTYWYSTYSASDEGARPESPIDPAALQSALPPEMLRPAAHEQRFATASVDALDSASLYVTPYAEDPPNQDYADSDRVPLTAGVQPISGSLAVGSHGSQPRNSFQTISDVDNSPRRGRDTKSLGQGLEPGFASTRHRSYGMSLNPNEYRMSRSPSTPGALQRAGSIVRAMSQRVVNISGESEVVVDQRASRHNSRSPRGSRYDRDRSPAVSMLVDTSYQPQTLQSHAEKTAGVDHFDQPLPPRGPPPNPLKGRTLGIFSPENRVRLWLCDVLVNPYTEPLILLLIVSQAILLAVESGPNVFTDGNGRPERWGQRPIDWAMLGLFIVFTLELIARIIVSGFFLNAAEYSTIDRKKGIRAVITEQYRAVFQPERRNSVKGSRQAYPQPSAFARSFTTIMQGQQALPETLEEQQRFQLARRAFLRHSFNRLDFIAVVSYWIAFLLGITGLEHRHHIYVFKMLSCLRILRLLALTHGTAVRRQNIDPPSAMLALGTAY